MKNISLGSTYTAAASGTFTALLPVTSLPVPSVAAPHVYVRNAPTIGVAGAVNEQVIDAVFSYIKTVRALGRTSINTTTVARALGIKPGVAEKAMVALRDKGIASLHG
jgi:hypothetical protein